MILFLGILFWRRQQEAEIYKKEAEKERFERKFSVSVKDNTIYM